jgi:hypothetical protein
MSQENVELQYRTKDAFNPSGKGTGPFWIENRAFLE